MKTIDFFYTGNGQKIELLEKTLTDNSIVYDIEILEAVTSFLGGDSYDLLMTVSAVDRKDADRRYDLLKAALIA